MENIASLIATEQQRFTAYKTYEELRPHSYQLQDEHPKLVRIELAGYGADRTPQYPYGRPIEATIISNLPPHKEAERPYALVQFEHENELPATLAPQLIAEVLCKQPEILDELDYNLILLNTTHPDGIALQRWVEKTGGVFDPLLYALWFFRSAAAEQIAWGYPFRYKKANFNTPVPEVQASMNIMKKYRPACLYPVHAAGIEGTHSYLTHPDPEFIAELTDASTRNGLVMQEGEPEIPYVNKIQPGIYHPVFTARAAYDYRARHVPPAQMSWSGGTTSAEYLSGIVKEPFIVLNEVPCLTADALQDTSSSGMTRREVGRRDIATRRHIIASVAKYFATIGPLASRSNAADVGRLARSIKWWHQDGAPPRLAANEKALESPAFDQEATKAEAYTVQRWDFYSTLFLGEVHHLARILGQDGMADDVQSDVTSRIEGINQASPLRISPLPNLVGAQALSGLVALRHSRRLRPR